jgi:hypothetical protein
MEILGLTEKQQEKIIDLYVNQNVGYTNIAKQINIGHAKIAEFLSSKSLLKKTHFSTVDRKSLTKDEIDLVFSLNESGINISSIHNQTGLHEYLIIRAFIENNKIPKHYDNIQRKNLNLSKEDELIICKLYTEENWTQRNIGKLFGIKNNPDVAAIIVKNGHVLRHPGKLKRRFSVETEKEICEKYTNQSERSLTREYNCDRTVIQGILTRNDIKLRTISEANIKKEYDIQLIIELFNAGNTLSFIAKELKLAILTVSRALDKAGIRKMKSGISGFKPQKLTNPEIKKEIINKYLQNKISIEKLAAEYLVSRPVIDRIFREYKIPIRDYSESGQKYFVDKDYFNEIDTASKNIVMGLLYSDGNKHGQNNTFSIELNNIDLDTVKFIKSELKYEGRLFDQKQKNSVILSIKNKVLGNRLIELGIVPNKSLIIEYPKWVSSELESHFIHGIFMGDGGITFGKTLGLCITGTLDLVSKIRDKLSTELGINIYLRQQGENTYTIWVQYWQPIIKICNYLFRDTPFIMKRKFELYEKIVEMVVGKARYSSGKAVLEDAKLIIKDIRNRLGYLL